jgi:hypothetical protein
MVQSLPLFAQPICLKSNLCPALESETTATRKRYKPRTSGKWVAAPARQLARAGHKSVIWTIFTGTILDLEKLLSDANPVTLYGQIPTGDEASPDTREGRIRRFHQDPACSVMIANPAAASEGISLHEVCHDAIYLDTSIFFKRLRPRGLVASTARLIGAWP